jgi:hypothetical protein
MKILIGTFMAIIGVVVLAFKGNAHLNDRFASTEDLFETNMEVASVAGETRKLALHSRSWQIDARIWYLDEKYNGAEAENEYIRRKYEELQEEKDCLEEALHIKDKWPRDCRP